MNLVTIGAMAALFMGACMGATLKPVVSVAAPTQQAPRLVVDPANTGLLASVATVTRSAG